MQPNRTTLTEVAAALNARALPPDAEHPEFCRMESRDGQVISLVLTDEAMIARGYLAAPTARNE